MMFEGVPTYPEPDRFWKIVEKFKVNIFYTAPTAIRALMREGDEPTQKHDLSSLRILGSVGEPINPEAWMWYYEQHRQGAAAHRRHLVADRDRRHHDLGPALRHAAQARLGHPAAARHRCGHRTTRTAPRPVPTRAATWSSASPGRACCAASSATRSATRRPTSPASRHLRPGRRRPQGRGRLLLDHGPARRRDQRLRPPPGHGRDRVAPWCAPRGRGRGGGGRHAARRSRARRIYAYVTLKTGAEESDELRKELRRTCARRSAPSPPRR